MPDPYRYNRQDGQINDLSTFQSCLGVATYTLLIGGWLITSLYFAYHEPGGLPRKVGVFVETSLLILAAAALVVCIPIVIASRFFHKKD